MKPRSLLMGAAVPSLRWTTGAQKARRKSVRAACLSRLATAGLNGCSRAVFAAWASAIKEQAI